MNESNFKRSKSVEFSIIVGYLLSKSSLRSYVAYFQRKCSFLFAQQYHYWSRDMYNKFESKQAPSATVYFRTPGNNNLHTQARDPSKA
jgi:hypothetical protein